MYQVTFRIDAFKLNAAGKYHVKSTEELLNVYLMARILKKIKVLELVVPGLSVPAMACLNMCLQVPLALPEGETGSKNILLVA